MERDWPVIITVLVFIGLYWGYCLYWGTFGFRRIRTGVGWAIAGRQLPPWLFMLAASATSFSAWTYIGHPGTIYAGGMAYAFAGLYAITIPFTGVLFIKRQWMMGRRFGFVTPPEQYGAILDSKLAWYMIVVISLLYSTFYVAIQLVGSGLLFCVLTGGFIPYFAGSVFLAFIMWYYVAGGGLRVIAWVDAIQFFLLVGGITTIGAGVLYGMGGWSGLMEKVATLPRYWTHPHGVLNYGWNWMGYEPELGKKMAQWTGIMMFSYMFALAGIQCSPAFTIWSYGLRDSKIVAWQTVVGIGVIIGSTLTIWSVVQGMGGRYLGMTEPGVWGVPALKAMIVGAGGYGAPSDAMVPKMMLTYLPLFFIGFAAIGLLAAAQSTAAPYVSSFAAIAARNLVGEALVARAMKKSALANGGNPERPPLSAVMTERMQVFLSRLFCTVLLIIAFIVAYFNPDLIVMLGGLAVSYAWQLFIPLVYIVYGWPRWVTGSALAWGLLMGVIAVTATYWWVPFRYPLAIHSAGWGIVFNALTVVLVSAITTRSKLQLTWYDTLREFFRTHDTAFYTPSARKWQKFCLFYMPFWWLMWVGPGLEFAPIFDGVLFGAPGLWLWLIMGYLTGVFMLWAMAFPAKMATQPPVSPEPIDEEARKTLSAY